MCSIIYAQNCCWLKLLQIISLPGAALISEGDGRVKIKICDHNCNYMASFISVMTPQTAGNFC